MALSRKSSGSDVTLADLKRRASGAWTTLSALKRRASGAWTTIWPAAAYITPATDSQSTGIPGGISQTFTVFNHGGSQTWSVSGTNSNYIQLSSTTGASIFCDAAIGSGDQDVYINATLQCVTANGTPVASINWTFIASGAGI